jgi:hypothetical protein
VSNFSNSHEKDQKGRHGIRTSEGLNVRNTTFGRCLGISASAATIMDTYIVSI